MMTDIGNFFLCCPRLNGAFEEIMWPGGRSELGWAKEGEAGIASLFRCSLTTAKPNAVDKTATELMKML
jgi:hypothetical protein